MKRLVMLALIMMATAGYAAIYVNQDKSGNLEYTDTPADGATEVQISPLNTVTSNPPETTAAPTKAEPAASKTGKPQAEAGTSEAAVSTTATYTTFNIISPSEGENIQNQPIIPVEMQVEPTMMAGDKIQLYLDGKATGTATSTIYQELGLVERGAHILYAEIINANQQPIKKSNTVSINVHRNSVITNPINRRP